MEVVFRPKTIWALPPVKMRVDKTTAEEDALLYAKSFRWFRRSRVPMLCWPWRLAQEIGWVIPSPVDVRITPLKDVEVTVPSAERKFFAQTTGLDDNWQRGDEALIAMEKAPWLRLYEADFNGEWESMFFPLGNGYVEWRLGWQAEIPDDHYLMVLPTGDLPQIEVSQGILDKKHLDEIGTHYGMAISFRPLCEFEIHRRQPIARILLLHADSIRAQARFEAPE